MTDTFHHETLYRGRDALDRLARVRLVVCGAGAVGSNLVDNLVRQGVRQVTVIDDDRVEAHNVGTQTYAESDVGAFKVDVLQAEVFRAVGVEITAVRQRLTERNVRKLLGPSPGSGQVPSPGSGQRLVVDGFDNHDSRALVTGHCRAEDIPCLHVGLHADYAEVLWNEGYRVPGDAFDPGADVCDYPLARNLIQFAVTLASEALVRYVLEGEAQNYSFTLADLKINVEE
jgi:molybdopterin/thiamine biosynthesis adenylyltransferase